MKLSSRLGVLLSTLAFGVPAWAQQAQLRPADEITLPTFTDGNSPSFWLNGRLHVFTSFGVKQELSIYFRERNEWETDWVNRTTLRPKDIWIEAAWVDANGVVFGWYHHEPRSLHPNPHLTAPKIGAVVSYDGGYTLQDLGIVLESGDELDPEAKNGFFSGGHGDFSVVLDQEREYFYFFFTNYGGSAESQGIALARLAFIDRFHPAGKVQKFHDGEWNEPGIGGRVTPIFPAQREWHHPDPESFWGPAVHWNTYLNSFVMLLNRAAGEPGWSQEGVYISFATDLSRPETWRSPQHLLDPAEVPARLSPYYPQVMGLEPGGTDTVAGQTARFYLNGASLWEIEFFASEKEEPPVSELPPP